MKKSRGFIFKCFFLIFFNCLFYLSNAQNFEGELIYSVITQGTLNIQGKDYDAEDEMIRRGEFYDTLKIIITGNQYKKTRNTEVRENIYFNLTDEKSAKVLENHEKIFIDDLSYLDLINRECSALGTINKFEILDTVIHRLEIPCKHLLIEGEYGVEEFIFSASLPKLSFNRNIILNEDCQIYPELISKEINELILISYKLRVMGITTIFSLENFTAREVSSYEVEIPSFKEKREDKKFNKFSERIKTYTLTSEE